MSCQTKPSLLRGWHLDLPCSGHTIPLLNSKFGVVASGPVSLRKGKEVTAPQPELLSLFCSPAGCKRSEGIYRPTGSPGEFYSAGEWGQPGPRAGGSAQHPPLEQLPVPGHMALKGAHLPLLKSWVGYTSVAACQLHPVAGMYHQCGMSPPFPPPGKLLWLQMCSD